MSGNCNFRGKKHFFLRKIEDAENYETRNLYFIFKIVYGRFYYIKFLKARNSHFSYREIVNGIIT